MKRERHEYLLHVQQDELELMPKDHEDSSWTKPSTNTRRWVKPSLLRRFINALLRSIS